jgi:hypothetical protein
MTQSPDVANDRSRRESERTFLARELRRRPAVGRRRSFIEMESAFQARRELPAMSRRTVEILTVLGWLLVGVAVHPAAGQIRQTPRRVSIDPPVIVVGFLGGFVRNDDDRHPEVRIIQRLDEERRPQFHAIVLENRRRHRALKEILHWLDTDGDGRLSTEEKQGARIVLSVTAGVDRPSISLPANWGAAESRSG